MRLADDITAVVFLALWVSTSVATTNVSSSSGAIRCETAVAQSWAGRIALFDTGKPSAHAATGNVSPEEQGWIRIEEDQKPELFRGDAVVVNGRLAVVFRKGSAGADAYGVSASGLSHRARLIPMGAGLDGLTISGCKTLQNDSTDVAVQATFEGKSGKAVVVFGLGVGKPFVKTTATFGATGLRVEAPARFGVLPDFIADDVLVDAAAVAKDRKEVPSNAMFVELTGGGDLLLVTVWDKNARNVELTFEGEDEQRVISGVEAPYGAGGSVWFALLEGKGIWHQANVAPGNIGKAVDLNWKIPFSAEWKCNLQKADYSADSWTFKYHMKDRSQSGATVGAYLYPAWIDGDAKGEKAHIQTPRYEKSEYTQKYLGLLVVYPINRAKKQENVADTPLNQFTVMDVMRETLGIGPCPGGTFMLMHESLKQ
ncbi:MAG: hypothetical protein C0404_14375 [Verrucomicrobia bacterium]|nr:hypothetical protein [Verrucomicrobiota bacterium]